MWGVPLVDVKQQYVHVRACVCVFIPLVQFSQARGQTHFREPTGASSPSTKLQQSHLPTSKVTFSTFFVIFSLSFFLLKSQGAWPSNKWPQ